MPNTALKTVPALVIRGISDLIYSQTTGTEGYQEIAARHASAFPFEILAKIEIEEADSESLGYDAWVGRDNLIKELSDRIRGNCRLLILVGITGKRQLPQHGRGIPGSGSRD